MSKGDWITAKEAAGMLGYSLDYFRRTFCDKDKPLLPLRIRKHRCRCRILVLKKAVLDLIEAEKV